MPQHKKAPEDTPRTNQMLIQRGMDPRSGAPFVEFTRQLERALGSIAANSCCDRCQEAAIVARNALKETE